MKYIAQNLMISGQPIQGPLVGINKISDLIGIVTAFLIPFAGVILLLVLIWGGYDLIFSGGEANKLSAGRMKVISGIVGFILLVLAYFLAKLTGSTFGLGGGIL